MQNVKASLNKIRAQTSDKNGIKTARDKDVKKIHPLLLTKFTTFAKFAKSTILVLKAICYLTLLCFHFQCLHLQYNYNLLDIGIFW